MGTAAFKEAYASLLSTFVQNPEERYLAEAADLGRALVRSGVPPEEIAEIHEYALRHFAQEFPDKTLLESVTRVSAPLMEMLMAYGLAFRELLDERKRTERELLESNSRLGKAQSVARMGFFDWDLTTDDIELSQDIIKLFGLHPDTRRVTPDFVARVIHPDDLAFVQSNMELTLKGEQECNIDHRVVRPDGTVIWVHAQADLIHDEDGNTSRLLGTVVDITERKHTEEALSVANDIINFSPAVAFLWKNEQGWPVQYVSRNVMKLFGYTAEEFMAGEVCYANVVHPDDLEVVSEQIAAYSKERHRNEFTQEYRIITKDGQVKWIDNRTCMQRNAEGEITHYQGIVLDITDRKQAEQRVWELNISLERRVNERTAELKAANRELEAFAYSVSHDLKAPLRGIDGCAGRLEEELAGSLNPECRRLLDMVRQKTHHMGRLIDELLTFSRIGRAALTITEVDMRSVAQSTFQELAAAHAGREIEFTIGDLPTLLADINLMRQVWTNLLDNAIKFTGPRRVARIEIGYREAADQHVFFVRDNGVGFDMEYVDKLFGVFQRLHYEDEFPGTGVGLANVRRAVERHGGEAWAEGAIDQGATIFFRLPRNQEKA